MDPNPEVVIPRTVKGTLNALEASTKHGKMKRFVLTSSSTTAITAKPNVEGIIVDERTYYIILKADKLITNVNMPSKRLGTLQASMQHGIKIRQYNQRQA
jgi:hypothetical protein